MAPLNVNNSTFSGNTRIRRRHLRRRHLQRSGTATVTNSILATSTGGNCAGTDAACHRRRLQHLRRRYLWFYGYGQLQQHQSAARHGGLANNGGPTQTIALQATSPAIDVIPPRQIARHRPARRSAHRPPDSANCDIGAFELQPTIIVNTLVDDPAPPGHGFCSLRDAINNANSPGLDTTGGDCGIGTGNDIITFSVSGTITLGSNLPAISNTSPAVYDRWDRSKPSPSTAPAYQILYVDLGATLTLNDLTIAQRQLQDHPAAAAPTTRAR